MKQILYIDPISSNGHIGFNKIYIDALVKIKDAQIDFVFRENYIKVPEKKYISLKLEIPYRFYHKNKGGIVNRYYFYKCLLYIKGKLNFKDYDYIIFGNYEEISFFCSGIRNKCYLINHHNIQGLDNPLKKFFYKLVSKRNTQVVFEKSFAKFLNSIGLNDITIVPHGLPQPFVIDNKYALDVINNFLGEYREKYNSLMFLPSSTSSDKSFVDTLIRDKTFFNYLKEKKILLIIKGDFNILNTVENIIVTKEYFSESLYRALFLAANFILIPYPNTFKNRVSGILFECMANNKLCLLSVESELINYKNLINYNPYFSDVSDLIRVIEENMQISENRFICRYKNLDSFKVKLSFINQ